MSEWPYPPSGLSEKETLETWLDFEREALERKIAGASEVDLRKPGVASGLTLLGLVQHLGYVERWWFQCAFAHEAEPAFPDDDDDSGTWRLADDATTDSVVAFYRDMCTRSREITARASLDDVSRFPGTDYSMRWILVHVIEETARHLGHADIIREQIDGMTGL